MIMHYRVTVFGLQMLQMVLEKVYSREELRCWMAREWLGVDSARRNGSIEGVMPLRV